MRKFYVNTVNLRTLEQSREGGFVKVHKTQRQTTAWDSTGKMHIWIHSMFSTVIS